MRMISAAIKAFLRPAGTPLITFWLRSCACDGLFRHEDLLFRPLQRERFEKTKRFVLLAAAKKAARIIYHWEKVIPYDVPEIRCKNLRALEGVCIRLRFL